MKLKEAVSLLRQRALAPNDYEPDADIESRVGFGDASVPMAAILLKLPPHVQAVALYALDELGDGLLASDKGDGPMVASAMGAVQTLQVLATVTDTSAEVHELLRLAVLWDEYSAALSEYRHVTSRFYGPGPKPTRRQVERLALAAEVAADAAGTEVDAATHGQAMFHFL